MPKRTRHQFTKNVEMDCDKLHQLLQGVADRAYQVGHRDGTQGRSLDITRVQISERTIWSIKTKV